MDVGGLRTGSIMGIIIKPLEYEQVTRLRWTLTQSDFDFFNGIIEVVRRNCGLANDGVLRLPHVSCVGNSSKLQQQEKYGLIICHRCNLP